MLYVTRYANMLHVMRYTIAHPVTGTRSTCDGYTFTSHVWKYALHDTLPTCSTNAFTQHVTLTTCPPNTNPTGKRSVTTLPIHISTWADLRRLGWATKKPGRSSLVTWYYLRPGVPAKDVPKRAQLGVDYFESEDHAVAWAIRNGVGSVLNGQHCNGAVSD